MFWSDAADEGGWCGCDHPAYETVPTRCTTSSIPPSPSSHHITDLSFLLRSWRVCSGVSLFNLPAQHEPTTTADTSQHLLNPVDMGLSPAYRSSSSAIVPAFLSSFLQSFQRLRQTAAAAPHFTLCTECVIVSVHLRAVEWMGGGRKL